MMTINETKVTVGEITRGYMNNDEQGVRGYDGRLDIRPPYQREFIYNEKEQQAVINTVLHGYPLNVMYWVKRSEDAECPYEVMDGQQRTLSLVSGFLRDFSSTGEATGVRMTTFLYDVPSGDWRAIVVFGRAE